MMFSGGIERVQWHELGWEPAAHKFSVKSLCWKISWNSPENFIKKDPSTNDLL